MVSTLRYFDELQYGDLNNLDVLVDPGDKSLWITYPTIEKMMGYQPDCVHDKLNSKKLKAFTVAVFNTILEPSVSCQCVDSLGRPNKAKAIPLESFLMFVYFEASNGKDPARKAAQSLIALMSTAEDTCISHPFKILGMMVSKHLSQGKDNKKTANRDEADIRDLLAERFNGQVEVMTKFGRCDIVTESSCIEVKYYKQWKSAIGQAVAYGIAENKKPVVALFGQGCIGDSFKKDVDDVCGSCGVEVIWV